MTVCNIAIVEDECAAADRLKRLITCYKTDKKITFNVDVFSTAEEFIESYNAGYHCIFMDISMPGMGGMKAAEIIRESDFSVLIVFVTSMTSYAVDGYSVGAYDFIVKPVDKGSFDMKFKRILGQIIKNGSDASIVISVGGKPRRVKISEILYVELFRHDLIYHLIDGRIVKRGAMSAAAKELKPHYFVLCNSCYLVNMKYISAIENGRVTVGDDVLTISRGKMKNFLTEYARYLGGGTG